MLPTSGKHSKSSKPKNSKQPKSQGETESGSGRYRIPLNNPIMDGDSDSDDIGQETLPETNRAAKFSSHCNTTISSMLKSSELLAPEFHSLCDDFNKLVLYSATKHTWAKHCSAWHLYEDFCKNFGIKFSLPIRPDYARAFVTWAATKKHLKSTTIKAYVSSLNVAHTISNVKNPNLSADACVKLALKGAKNLTDPLIVPKSNRLPMNIDLLIVLGHRISKLQWNDFAKQVLWTACSTSFFSSCRMGEILSLVEKNFDPKTSLLWENVNFLENKEILLYIQYSKTTGFSGKFIDIYPIQNSKLCPASALIRLKKMAEKEGVYEKGKPVFTFKSGKFLTKAKLNFWLSKLLFDFTDENYKITGHSFRAAIPSLLAAHPDISSVKEIKEWGGWSSDSYSLYTKSKRDERKTLFDKIVRDILNL